MIGTTTSRSLRAQDERRMSQNVGRGSHIAMRDIRADWKHWSQVERILAVAFVASTLTFAVGTMISLQA